VVFTNGCFDILHRGHVDLLRAARDEGDLLVVGVNSDASVRRLKGEGRPLVPAGDRTAVLAALESVDLVVVFDEDTPAALIRELRPDVLVKGADYREDEVVGGKDVAAWGGRVRLVPLTEGRSTSGLLKRLTGEQDRTGR
jgi:D-beta-D-heptose 7-phosphate kinase/D-beta-D-heptose 1-phosphate adenosyltransferase